jgi:hypothetical protein
MAEWQLTGETEVRIWRKVLQFHSLSATDLTWPDLGSNQGHRCGKSLKNHLSYDTARRINKILKLVVCILLRVLGQVQGFRLTQHWFEYFIQ